MTNNGFFLVFCLALAMGLMHSYHRFTEYFSPEKDLRMQVSRLEHDVSKEKLKLALAENQMRDIQYEIASVSPVLTQQLGLNQRAEVRKLASVAAKGNPPLDYSSALMDVAKKYFNEKNYEQAVRAFSQVISQYPASAHVIEAQFFLAESLFLTSKFSESLDVIERMMGQFPDSELTGFIMLRMGQIFEERGRKEDAILVYKTVQNAFSYNKSLLSQAETLESKVQ